ncbi:aromatic ring-hydroxylating dioxygenase subunit alpha [Halioxenophilus sp. WMMB6]|uniref:aromatic ring-hydroxylating oxygenase subunit alpha n=1 Tax=Halioxenophilus sp. WMMB6 TaxID=3073815 RepID=UPI00295EF26B|nr:aromatic ring-hydroxylating dioxygenase subunit alpha [Halioxenophilus sp. WMMB6]
MGNLNETTHINSQTLAEGEPLHPVICPVEAYISEDYVKLERDRLWRKVWLRAGRVEEIPEVGNYITYDILDDSILIVRSGPETINAFYNVCTHRGRRLVDTPPGQMNAQGKTMDFTCGFHGWNFNLTGQCTYVLAKEEWAGTLTDERTRLGEVKVDTWGGWIWINLDPNCEPLRDYLEPAASMLDPFQLENMRYKWRKWVVFDCNWKVALEAFDETYHIMATHPEFMAFGAHRGWAKAQGKHSNIGYDAAKGEEENQGKLRLAAGKDARVATAKMQQFIKETVNAVTTDTLIKAANRLVEDLPADTPPDQVLKYWHESAKKIDAERGVFWPEVDSAHVAKSGTAWQIFPNAQIGHSVNNALCYTARPFGYDPNKCYFEVSALELFPEGEEPKAQWQRGEPTAEDFGPVIYQDFSNMAAVQAGMRNGGYRGNIPNPKAEGAVISLHRNLAKYMGTGAPEPIK